LIDTALQNNQGCRLLQEIEIAKNEAQIRQGFLPPTVQSHETSVW
jgi:hypothetical protein